MDEIDRITVLKQDDTVRTETYEILEKKNKVNIAKLVWFSWKDNDKIYESMVILMESLGL